MSAVLAHPAHAVVTDGLTVERFLEIAAEALGARHVVVADERGEVLAWAPVAARADATASAQAAVEDDPPDPGLYVARLTDVPARFLALRWGDLAERALEEAHGVAATVAAMLARGMDTELDALTGLPTRSATLHALRERIADRRTAMAGVAFIDLDGSKLVNDRFGHAAGDRALGEAGRRLRTSARAGDVVGRHGGDEFVAAVGGAGPEEILEAVERFRRALRFDVEQGGARIPLSASVGVALYPAHGRCAEELIERADAAMYVAKRNGGDVVRCVDDEGTAAVTAPIATPVIPVAPAAPALSAVESIALDFARDVVVCFQPIVDVANGPTLRGWEALLRWRHPARGWLRPPLPSGMLRDADDWLAVHIETLLGGRIPSAPIHLNVTAFDEVAVERVERLFAARPELRGWIALELAASAAHDDLAAAAPVASRLRELGAGVGLEGVTLAGSQLDVLVALQLDFVKLDVAHVDDPAVLARTMQIVLATGATPYVQGVASAHTADLLASAGAAGLQGYGIASPMLAADASSWIASHRWLQPVLRVTPEAVRAVSAVR